MTSSLTPTGLCTENIGQQVGLRILPGKRNPQTNLKRLRKESK